MNLSMMSLDAKTTPLHLLILEGMPILEQLQLEEALLRADQGNWCIVNRGSPPAIVMGISGKPELLVNQKRLSSSPVPLIRRFSGGGTVFIDPQTFFVSWICNSEHTGVSCCPNKLHLWIENFYQKTWPSLQMRLQENDYVIGNRKFGGNAQYLCRQRWLHHSSLLWDFQKENMDYLLMPTKVPKYREERSHDSFLCRLRDYFISWEAFEQQLFESLHREFYIQRQSLKETLNILKRPHRKATTLLT